MKKIFVIFGLFMMMAVVNANPFAMRNCTGTEKFVSVMNDTKLVKYNNHYFTIDFNKKCNNKKQFIAKWNDVFDMLVVDELTADEMTYIPVCDVTKNVYSYFETVRKDGGYTSKEFYNKLDEVLEEWLTKMYN